MIASNGGKQDGPSILSFVAGTGRGLACRCAGRGCACCFGDVVTAADDEPLALAAKVSALNKSDNAIDVLCEIAMFEPDECELAIRANSAGTKVILTIAGGKDRTVRADDWTLGANQRRETARLLRARYGDRGRAD